MLNTPFAPWPSFTPEEADAVQQALLSNKVNYWTGTEGREFEKEFAAHCHVKHAIALANGTVALELALYALGIGPGDEVITTSAPLSPRLPASSCAAPRQSLPTWTRTARTSPPRPSAR